MSDPFPFKTVTPEEAAALFSAPVMEVVSIGPDNFGLAVDVAHDEDETIIERQYFTFDSLDSANTFRALLKGGFN